jgi:hypothetical protein
VAALLAAEGLTPLANPVSVLVTLAHGDRAASPALQSLPAAAAALPISGEVTPSFGDQPQAQSRPPLSEAPPLTAPQSLAAAAKEPVSADGDLHPSASRLFGQPMATWQGSPRGHLAEGEMRAAVAESSRAERISGQAAEIATWPGIAPDMAVEDNTNHGQQLSMSGAEAAAAPPVSASAGASDVQRPRAEPDCPPLGHAPWQIGTSVDSLHEAAARLLASRETSSLQGSLAAPPTGGDRPPADHARRKATLRPATSGAPAHMESSLATHPRHWCGYVLCMFRRTGVRAQLAEFQRGASSAAGVSPAAGPGCSTVSIQEFAHACSAGGVGPVHPERHCGTQRRPRGRQCWHGNSKGAQQ